MIHPKHIGHNNQTLTIDDMSDIMESICVSVLPKQSISVYNVHEYECENDNDYQNTAYGYQKYGVLSDENE